MKIQSVDGALAAVLEQAQVRFLGNVEVGTDLTLDELHRHYDAVALRDRRGRRPAARRAGRGPARQLLGDRLRRLVRRAPGRRLDAFRLHARRRGGVGVGNVAVDVARMLAKTADELAAHRRARPRARRLAASAVEEVTMLGRRGPAQARFTTKELRELGELAART